MRHKTTVHGHSVYWGDILHSFTDRNPRDAPEWLHGRRWRWAELLWILQPRLHHLLLPRLLLHPLPRHGGALHTDIQGKQWWYLLMLFFSVQTLHARAAKAEAAARPSTRPAVRPATGALTTATALDLPMHCKQVAGAMKRLICAELSLVIYGFFCWTRGYEVSDPTFYLI
jgi:hypothetical protein